MRAKQLAFGLTVILGFCSARVGDAAIRVVAYSGQQAPGMTAGVEFDEFGDSFSIPRIDGQGRVAFAGFTRNPNLSLGPSGIWTERTGALTVLVKQNDPAPGTSSTFTGSFTTSLVVNKSGHSVFRSQLSGGNFGYFTDRTGSLTNIASEGLMTAFGPLTSFDGSNPMLIDDSGRTTFEAFVDAETGVLLKEVAGGPAIVAVEGMDTLGDHRFKIVTGSPFLPNAMTGVGHVLATASLEGKTNNTLYTQGLYRDSSGAFAAIQLNLTPAPGEAANFASIEDPAMNNAGQTVFEALLSGPSVTDATNHGIWYLTTGAPTRLMRDGTQAPDAAAGVLFSNALGDVQARPVINGAGKALFHYGLTGPGVTTANDLGLWAGTPGNLAKVVREGDPAPGLGAGATFTSITGGSARAINGAGQVAFYAFFNAPGGAGAGLFAQDTAGVIQLIARTGQTIQIAPGDVRTIETLQVINTGPTGNQDGRATFFNDQGHLAFRATFTDVEETDAILVSDGVASPYRAADFQEDHDVDNNDLTQWRANFGLAASATHTQGNADFDGDVDGGDFLIWQQQRGSGPLVATNAQPVPEPGAITLAATAMALGLSRRRSAR